MRFSSNVRKIDLPKKNEKFDGNEKAFITGFGATAEDGEMISHLRGVYLPTLPNTECEKTELYVPDTICAGFKEGKRDACQVCYINQIAAVSVNILKSFSG